MKAVIRNSSFGGKIKIPSSKSYTHRLLISGALYNYIHNTPVEIINILDCDDSIATLDILSNLGFIIRRINNNVLIEGYNKNDLPLFNCNASGSTARFFIPILSYFYDNYSLKGIPKLISRLQTVDINDLNGLKVTFTENVEVKGKLNSDLYSLSQKNTTQFISGMIFSMVLYGFKIKVDGVLNPYILMTIDSLRRFGFKIKVEEDRDYSLISYMEYCEITEAKVEVEADHSNASYFHNINYLDNNCVLIDNLNYDSLQGDKIYIEFLDKIRNSKECTINIESCPDLGPALFALSSVSGKLVTITGIEKLYLKESNRVDSMICNLNKLGADIEVVGKKVIVQGKDFLEGGATVDSFNDHRIVMALASIASKVKNPYTITNIEAINKSYPEFFSDYLKISGKVELGE